MDSFGLVLGIFRPDVCFKVGFHVTQSSLRLDNS